MSSSDFRQIAIRTEAGKAERLFRAAVSAFCSLTRPSRREIAQLEDLTLPLFDEVSVAPETVTKFTPKPEPVAKEDADRATSGEGAENARRRLRSMMRPAGDAADVNSFLGQPAYVRLRETALTGNAAFFQTALADALEIDFATARSVTGQSGYAALLAALRALDLSEDRAFL
ncbi:MAG: hypothetical protein E5X69_22055, partial [Mesorhizobium sp.]